MVRLQWETHACEAMGDGCGHPYGVQVGSGGLLELPNSTQQSRWLSPQKITQERLRHILQRAFHVTVDRDCRHIPTVSTMCHLVEPTPVEGRRAPSPKEIEDRSLPVHSVLKMKLAVCCCSVR